MSTLSEEGRAIVADLAGRHGFSEAAVTELLHAVAAGHGSQAQFSHPEFGGMGQWSGGGMIMIGDMFNNMLAGRVAALCQEIAGILAERQPFAPRPARSQSQSQSQSPAGGWQAQGGNWQGQAQGSGGFGGGFGGGHGDGAGSSLFVPGSGGGTWWPAGLGTPSSTGGQNDLRYAWFPETARLAIDLGGRVTLYDTGPHQIGGVSQQQGGDRSLTFTSQFGLVRLADLPVVPAPGEAARGEAGSHGASPGVATRQEAGTPPGAPPPPADPTDPLPADPAPADPRPADAAPGSLAAAEPDLSPRPDAVPDAFPTAGAAPGGASAGAAAPAEAAARRALDADEIFALIEKLAALHARGILTDSEYEAKKADLLDRL